MSLKLQALDDADLTMLSSLLQDATVLIGDMAYDKEGGQFLMVAARFLRDSEAHDNSNGGARRRLTGVNFAGVRGVVRQGFALNTPDDVLNLLALRIIEQNPDGVVIELVFSGKATIRLESASIKIYAVDLNEGWHTAFTPIHKTQ